MCLHMLCINRKIKGRDAGTTAASGRDVWDGTRGSHLWATAGRSQVDCSVLQDVRARFQLVCFSTCMHQGNSGLRDKASFERHVGHTVVGSDKGMGAPKVSDSSPLPQES